MYEAQITLLTVRETKNTRAKNPEDVAKFCEDMKKLAQEQMVVLTLTTKNKIIDRHLVSLGTLNTTLVHPREVFRVAIMDAAAMIILVHNHPSGDPGPSAEDIAITKKMIKAGEIIGIKVMDHIIIGSEGHLSLNESGLVEFN